jgi:hypothetical protein
MDFVSAAGTLAARLAEQGRGTAKAQAWYGTLGLFDEYRVVHQSSSWVAALIR